jgi:hypothetical protein
VTLDPQLAAAIRAAALGQRDALGRATFLCDVISEVYDVAKTRGDQGDEGLDGLDSAERRSLGLVRDQAFVHLESTAGDSAGNSVG